MSVEATRQQVGRPEGVVIHVEGLRATIWANVDIKTALEKLAAALQADATFVALPGEDGETDAIVPIGRIQAILRA